MDEGELQAIRKARLAELQRNGGGGGGPGPNKDEAQQEDMRLSLLAQVLSPEARERLSRIRIVRGDRAKSIEDLIIQMARNGQIQKKVTEPELVQLLDQISQQESKTHRTKIVFSRRTTDEDDDDDLFD